MTIALSYDATLSRIQIDLSALTDGSVQVQRVLNASATDALWSQGIVRGCRLLAIQSGVAVANDAEFFADQANHYRVVPVDPPAGLLLDGTSGAYASTPDVASLDVTGDLSLRGLVRNADWASAVQTVVAKWTTTGDQRSYMLWVGADGTLNLSWSTDGTALGVVTATADVPPVPDADGQLAVRADLDVDNGSSEHEVTFWTAAGLSMQWTRLGTTQTTAGITSVHAGTGPLEVGANAGGTDGRWTGSVIEVEVYDGIDASETLVADPDFAAEATGTTSFDDSQALTWTVNGTAEILGPVLDTGSITPSLDGQVWLKSIAYPSLNTVVTVSDYGAVGLASRSAAFGVSGRSLPLGVTDHTGGRDHPLVLATEDDAAAAALSAILRTGGTLFVHVPTEAPPSRDGLLLLPGSMYVLLEATTGIERLGGVSRVQHHVLPVTEVARPGPDVVGTTITWGTVERLYGSWEALVAAHPSWRSALASVGDPDDPFEP